MSRGPWALRKPSDFAIEEAALPPLQYGEVCAANQLLSVGPAMRGWIADSGNYSDPVPIGGVMRPLAVGKIVESRSPDWRTGQIVLGWFGWQKFATVKPEAIVRAVTQTDLPASLALRVLGINDITALLALTLVGEPKPGDALVVSTAAGFVGSAAGQIGRMFGCRSVGIAGGADKVLQYLKEFGYDAAIDYKAGPLDEAIAQACPDGVEIYFDNTSGPVSDAVLPHLALGARVVNCGTAAIDRQPAPGWNATCW